ncbi:MAG: cupin domain-containing protein [Gimesia sp.]|nr:cupin domain-containing protein [Gimesia sp.]
MADSYSEAGELINVSPLGSQLESMKTTTLVKTDHLQIIRLIMQAGKSLPNHSAPGILIIQCLEGRVIFQCLGKTHELSPGHMLHLPPAESHAVECLETASLLLTIFNTPAPNGA